MVLNFYVYVFINLISIIYYIRTIQVIITLMRQFNDMFKPCEWKLKKRTPYHPLITVNLFVWLLVQIRTETSSEKLTREWSESYGGRARESNCPNRIRETINTTGVTERPPLEVSEGNLKNV